MKTIILGNKKYKNRVNKTIINNNLTEFFSKFDKCLIDYLQNINHVKHDYINSLRYLYFKTNIKSKEEYIKEYYYQCKINPDIRGIKLITGTRTIYPLKEHSKYFKSSTRGKKRPEFAKKMKTIMKGKVRSKEHIANNKKHLQGNYFRKRMLNLGVITKVESEILPILFIKTLFSDYMSELNKSYDFRKKVMQTYITENNYPEDYKTFNLLFPNINKKNIKEAWTFYNSIKSTRAMKDPKNNMGAHSFKRPTLTNLKYNKRKITTIKVKSSWEEKTVNFFEENKILWDYETKTITYGNRRRYTPDFIVEYKGTTYYIEVKGFHRKENTENTIEKSLACINILTSKEKFIIIRTPFNNINYFKNTYNKKNYKNIKKLL